MARKLQPITLTWQHPGQALNLRSGDRFKVKGYSNKYICIVRVEPHWQNAGSYQRDLSVWEKPSRGYAKHIRKLKANGYTRTSSYQF